MRKLKLQMQLSIDGFVAGPNGEMDFLIMNWDEALNAYVDQLTRPVDCIVLGRKLAEGFIPYWAGVAADEDNPETESGQFFTNTPKIVFSRTLDESEWEHTVLAGDDLVEEINALKRQEGGDIIAYGGAEFVSSLIAHDLIDEYHLFVNPAAIGAGMPIFRELVAYRYLSLVRATPFECGIVVVQYEPRRDR